jgi:hypothetical protein
MRETPRRRRQIEAWVRHQADELQITHEGKHFPGAKKAAARFTNILWADASEDTRKAAAHMLQVYRGVQGFGVTRYLRDISFIAEKDDGWDALYDEVVLQDLGILKDVEESLNRFGHEKLAGFAFDICSESFHERMAPVADLVNLILVERAERLEKKMAKRIPPDGMRVELPANGCIDRYPHFHLEGTITGTVVHHATNEFVVVVDQHFCDLHEWENEVSYVDLVEHFWDEWIPIQEGERLIDFKLVVNMTEEQAAALRAFLKETP